MDTSETYIKMEASAWGEEPIDLTNIIPEIYVDADGDWWADVGNRNILLHRQDQLQEMISRDINKLIAVFWNELKWGEKDNTISHHPMYVINLKSMEQLWLAFVKKEKDSKVWNGEEWVE